MLYFIFLYKKEFVVLTKNISVNAKWTLCSLAIFFSGSLASTCVKVATECARHAEPAFKHDMTLGYDSLL